MLGVSWPEADGTWNVPVTLMRVNSDGGGDASVNSPAARVPAKTSAVQLQGKFHRNRSRTSFTGNEVRTTKYLARNPGTSVKEF